MAISKRRNYKTVTTTKRQKLENSKNNTIIRTYSKLKCTFIHRIRIGSYRVRAPTQEQKMGKYIPLPCFIF